MQVGTVEGFYLFEESGFSGVVEAEEEDGVFCFFGGAGCLAGVEVGREGGKGRGGEANLLCLSRGGRLILLGDTLWIT